jgi:hypothetical protein
VVTPVRPPPPPKKPFRPPVGTIVLVLLTIGMLALYARESQVLYTASAIIKVDGHDASTWYRLLAGLFIHGRHHELQAMIVLSILAVNGYRTERGIGASGLLASFVAGGVVGNVVRLFLESPALLEASAATTAGALALTGSAASIAVRLKLQSIPRALVSGMGSGLMTVLFSAGQLQGAYVFSTLPDMLPSAGAAFLVGGFVGSLWPLTGPAVRKLPRVAVVAVLLALFTWAGFATFQSLKKLKARTQEQVEQEDMPGLERMSAPGFDYSFGAPISHHMRNDPKVKGAVILDPNSGFGLPMFVVSTVKRIGVVPWEGFDAEGAALYFLQHRRVQAKEAKPFDEGKVKLVPLGPTYKQIMLHYEGEVELLNGIIVVQAPEDFVFIEVEARSEDQLALSTAVAIARSLKVLPDKADK